MKIENTSMSPLSARPTDSTRPVTGKESLKNAKAARPGQDRVEMSEDARLMAKARAALGDVADSDAEKLVALREKVENGDYTVQVTELARKLAAKFYPK